MKKRDRLGVIFDLLKVISDHNNIKPTPLLRRSNLSSQRFSEYLNEMLKKGFIREALDNKNKKFLTNIGEGKIGCSKKGSARLLRHDSIPVYAFSKDFRYQICDAQRNAGDKGCE